MGYADALSAKKTDQGPADFQRIRHLNENSLQGTTTSGQEITTCSHYQALKGSQSQPARDCRACLRPGTQSGAQSPRAAPRRIGKPLIGRAGTGSRPKLEAGSWKLEAGSWKPRACADGLAMGRPAPLYCAATPDCQPRTATSCRDATCRVRRWAPATDKISESPVGAPIKTAARRRPKDKTKRVVSPMSVVRQQRQDAYRRLERYLRHRR